MKRRKVLLKKIVIPAGTIFNPSPKETIRVGDDHFECIVGLTDNTYGVFEYDLSDDQERMKEYFADLEDWGDP